METPLKYPVKPSIATAANKGTTACLPDASTKAAGCAHGTGTTSTLKIPYCKIVA